MNHFIAKIRRTAAEILAAAVFEMFPGVELRGGSETYSGFFYDFFFPHPIHPELHLQIEEKMRQIVREKREIKDIEMVGTSAKAFLKSLDRADLAKQIEGPDLFSMVQIGSFIDLASGEHLKNSSGLPAFKLFPPIPLEEKGMRILGTAHESKEELKEFLKKWNAYPKGRHEKLGELRRFWRFRKEGIVWMPEGLKAREKLILLLKENLFPGAFEVSCPEESDRSVLHKKLFEEIGVEAIFEVFSLKGEPSGVEEVGFLDPMEGKRVQMTTSLKNMISLLQSIGKTLNILGFTSRTVEFSGSRRNAKGGKLLRDALKELEWTFQESEELKACPQVDFWVADGLGRSWSAAHILATECLTVQVIVERNLALLLELESS